MSYILIDKDYSEFIEAKTLGEAIGFYIDNRSDITNIDFDRELGVAYITQAKSISMIKKYQPID